MSELSVVKKRIEVKAWQIVPKNELDLENVPDWVALAFERGDDLLNTRRGICYFGGRLVVGTLEGNTAGDYDDYLICGIKGELYPCKKEIFEESYAEIDEEADVFSYQEMEIFAKQKVEAALLKVDKLGYEGRVEFDRSSVREIVNEVFGDGKTKNG